MKKTMIMATALLTLMTLSGCVGWLTNYNYDVVRIYKVTKSGVTKFMTEEQIKELKLDKTAYIIESGYEIVEMGNEEDNSSVE